MMRLFVFAALLATVIADVADDAPPCPKESFWREKQCFGTDINAPENDRDRYRLGFVKHPRARIDERCCKCPKRARMVGVDCVVRSGWGKRITLPDSCCNGERRNGPAINPNDPARDLYKDITGKSFLEAVPPKPKRNWFSRDLLGFGSCSASGKTGNCQDVSTCSGTSVPGKCSGSHRIQCCISDSNSGSGAPAPRVPSSSSSSNNGNAPASSGDFRPAVNWDHLQNRNHEFSSHEGLGTASTVRGLCPNLYKVWNAYPPITVDSQELVDAMGMSWITNTCTVRGTLALGGIGINPGEIGRTKWIGKGKRYLIRVAEMVPFLTATFGPPIAKGFTRKTNTYESDGIEQKAWLPPSEIMGVAGMIHFGDCVFTDATGHIDVWDGANIREHDYFHRCRSAAIYDVCRPKANPDYTAWKQHLRRTNAV